MHQADADERLLVGEELEPQGQLGEEANLVRREVVRGRSLGPQLAHRRQRAHPDHLRELSVGAHAADRDRIRLAVRLARVRRLLLTQPLDAVPKRLEDREHPAPRSVLLLELEDGSLDALARRRLARCSQSSSKTWCSQSSSKTARSVLLLDELEDGSLGVLARARIRLARLVLGLVLGLYPNANADIKRVSAMEKEMLKMLAFESVEWVDLCPLSSRSTNSVINQVIVETFAEDEALVSDYFRLFAERLRAGTDATRCVAIAGGSCQAALDAAISLKIVTRESRLSATHDVSIMSIGGKRFIALEHAPHPSWHLMSARDPKAVRI
ncbi:hypothetical protein T492DRAFT_51184 [Pavlovales sp. CCMP2436]|nr:hypothetical protein T492DRAFT_51184 [Pavlovales sp. CCMP2436]